MTAAFCALDESVKSPSLGSWRRRAGEEEALAIPIGGQWSKKSKHSISLRSLWKYSIDRTVSHSVLKLPEDPLVTLPPPLLGCLRDAPWLPLLKVSK